MKSGNGAIRALVLAVFGWARSAAQIFGPTTIRHAIALVLVLFSAQAASESLPLTAKAVLRQIDDVGASKTIEDFFSDSDLGRWNQVLNGIGTADPRWLQVYTRLRAASDGESGETLSDAIAEAVPRQPFTVLPIIRREVPNLSIEELCTFTFEGVCPKDGIKKYLDRLEQALVDCIN